MDPVPEIVLIAVAVALIVGLAIYLVGMYNQVMSQTVIHVVYGTLSIKEGKPVLEIKLKNQGTCDAVIYRIDVKVDAKKAIIYPDPKITVKPGEVLDKEIDLSQYFEADELLKGSPFFVKIYLEDGTMLFYEGRIS